MMSKLLLMQHIILLSIELVKCWNWSKVPKWADVYLRKDGFHDLEYKLGFLMDNYDIISLEKCLYEDSNDQRTEDYFVNLTSQMRSLRPASESKILFYWHLTQIVSCYEATEAMLSRPDLWLYDDDGYPVQVTRYNVA